MGGCAREIRNLGAEGYRYMGIGALDCLKSFDRMSRLRPGPAPKVDQALYLHNYKGAAGGALYRVYPSQGLPWKRERGGAGSKNRGSPSPVHLWTGGGGSVRHAVV